MALPSGTTAGSGHAHTSETASMRTLQEAAALDLSKLSGAGGPTYLIIYLHNLQAALAEAQVDEVTTLSPDIQDALRNLWAPASNTDESSSAAICAGRPCRGLLCRVYTALFTKLGGSGLFDTVATWSRLALSASTQLDTRITAFYLSAALFASMGNTIPTLALESLGATVRIFRTSTLPYRLRYAASVHIAKCIACSGMSLTYQEAREHCKQLRACLTDKSGVIQRGAAECLSQLFTSCFSLHTMIDIDQVLLLSFKAQEQADWQARQQHAHLCSSLLLLTQVSRSPSAEGSHEARGAAIAADSHAVLDIEESSTQARDKSRKTLLSIEATLGRLTDAYNKPSNTSKGRNAVIQVMALLFSRLGASFLCDNIQEIWQTLTSKLADGPHSKHTVQASQTTESYVTYLVARLVCNHLLHEPEQLLMLGFFVERCLPQASSMSDQKSTSLVTLRMSLKQVQALLESLGQSTIAEDHQLEQTLLALCAHTDPMTRNRAQDCLNAYTRMIPSRLHTLIVDVLEILESRLLNKEQKVSLDDLTGQAGALSSLVSLLRNFPLYASKDVCTRAMSTASLLLKNAGDRDLAASTLIVRSAWRILAGILSLPRHLISVHLPQILLLWRNALPKSSHRETTMAEKRTVQEWSFLLSIRQAVLDSIITYLERHNTSRSEGDVIRRIAALLNHALAFNTSVPAFRCQPEDIAQSSEIKKLEQHRLSFLKNLLRALGLIGSHPSLETSRIALCNLCVTQILRRDLLSGAPSGNMSQAVSADYFWEHTEALPAFTRDRDGNEFDSATPIFGAERSLAFKEFVIEEMPRTVGVGDADLPPLPSEETGSFAGNSAALLDAAVRLLACLFPLVPSSNQMHIIDMLAARLQHSSNASNRQERELTIPLVTLLGCASLLARSLAEHRKAENIEDEPLLRRIRDVLLPGLSHSDSILRKICTRGIASLCAVGPSTFLSSQIQATVAMIVTNTDPYVRSGCVQLFADVYSAVGAIAARPALKTVLDVTMTLAADPHPTVHYWSLRAVTVIAHTAGLDFTPYIGSCIGLVTRIGAADSHDSDGGTLATATMRGDLPVRQAICAVVDCLIAAAGPDLYELRSSSQVVSALVQSFLTDEDMRVAVQAGSALQSLLLISPPQVITPQLVEVLVNQLHSSILAIQISAVNAIYQIVRRDVLLMSRLGGDKLVERLYTILDADPSVNGVKQTITTWMLQTATSNPAGWLSICRKVLSQESANWQVADKEIVNKAVVEDEEAQGLQAVLDDNSKAPAQGFLARWPTRVFALTCATSLINHLHDMGCSEHLAEPVTAKRASVSIRKLHSRIPDLIRMALVSSTSSNLHLKIHGLELLQRVIFVFRKETDTQFDHAPLLEQYQASIIAAASPAFEPDSDPEVLIAAINLCGQFVAAGISRDPGDSARALRLLDTSLEQSAPPAAIHTAQMACGAAWARICVASLHNPALRTVIDAKATNLASTWRGILAETSPDRVSSGCVNIVLTDQGQEDGQAFLLDVESWLLVLKAWTVVSQASSEQHVLTENLWSLLGEVCRCIDRHVLAEALQPSQYSTAALIIDCLASLLNLAHALRTYQDDIGTWHELLQISYRLYLMNCAVVDKQLVLLVATLAACGRHQAETPEKQAYLQACVQLELLICDRSLKEGTEEGINLAASAWMASNATALLDAPTELSATLLPPWALLQRYMPAFRFSEVPITMLQAVQHSAILLSKLQQSHSQDHVYPLDNLVAGLLCGYQRSMSGQSPQTINAACLYLQILSVIVPVVIDAGQTMTTDILTGLHGCVGQALASDNGGIRRGGILLGKALSNRRSIANPSAPLFAAHVLSEVLHLLSATTGHDISAAALPYRDLLGLAANSVRLNGESRSLLLDVYAWLLEKKTESGSKGVEVIRAVLGMMQASDAGFRQAYANLAPARQQALQIALGREGQGNDSSSKNREAQPTIELKLFS